MKKILILVLAMCLLVTGCTIVPKNSDASGDNKAQSKSITRPEIDVKAEPLVSVSSYDEVCKLLKAYQTRTREADAVETMGEVPVAEEPAEAGNGIKAADSAGSDFSGTNVQTEGIDEADIIKTDGEYIYYMSGSTLKIIKANGKNPQTVSETKLSYENDDGYSYYDNIYISGKYLVAVGQSNNYDDYNRSLSIATIYDISDPANIKKTEEFSQTGYISSTRMVGDTLYMISTYYVWNFDENEPDTYIPCFGTLREERLIDASNICIPEEAECTSWLTVAAYDVSDCTRISEKTMLSSADTVYMSNDNLFVSNVSFKNDVSDEYKKDQYTVTDYYSYSQTNIHKFSYSDGEISYLCSGAVKGRPLNQFSFDEYDGNLRVVTTNGDSSYSVYRDEKYGFENYEYGDNGSDNGLYVLDDELNVIGSVEGLGENERVYSARFMGDVGYFVTYRETDPLFAVDLSVPTEPKVLSELKINGFSEYLHSWGDGLLLGLGMDSDDEGNVSSMKLSMFDISDPYNVSEASKLVIPYNYSQALYDHHAVYVDVERSLIGFGADADYVVYKYNNGEFNQLSEVKEANMEYNSRGVRIDDYLYVVSNEKISVIDL